MDIFMKSKIGILIANEDKQSLESAPALRIQLINLFKFKRSNHRNNHLTYCHITHKSVICNDVNL